MLFDLLPERLALRIECCEHTGCWTYTGKWNSGDGYSKISWKNKPTMVHRLMYELIIGPIPEGLVLDHKECKNRACCNPLEPVTQKVNIYRGKAVLFKGESTNAY